MIKKGNLNDFIHVMWYCISSEGSRYEDFEIKFIKEISEKIPVIVVLTKTHSKKDAKDLQDKIYKKIKSEEIKSDVIILRAMPYFIEDEEKEGNQIELKSFGLEELISKTSDLLPEAQKKALAMVQKINLEMKEKEAYNIVRVYCATNTVASFIPWGDVIAILPSNIAMLVQITKLYEFNASKDFLELIVAECFTFIIARLPIMGVANLIKMIPIIGNITGGLFSSSMVVALTQTMGDSYISVMNDVYRGKLKEDEIKSESFIKNFVAMVKRRLDEKNFFKKH